MVPSFTETIASQTSNLDLTTMRSSRSSLSSLCTDLLLIAIRMKEAEDLGEPSALRKLINHYLELYRKNCELSGTGPEKILDTQYALVALLDETVLSSPGACRDYWITRPLQLDIFGDNIAGEEFYRKLKKLLLSPGKNLEVLEVYYLCLSLGFEGKYRISDTAERIELIQNLGQKIRSMRMSSSCGLSPHGMVTGIETFPKAEFSLFPLWVSALILVSALSLFCSVIYMSIHEKMKSLIEALERMVN